MNIEDYREFCLSLGEDVEEKLPFAGSHVTQALDWSQSGLWPG